MDLDGIVWQPIGHHEQEVAFSGRFDGGRHTIRGLSVSVGNTDCGLFGQVAGASPAERAAVANLTVYGTIQGEKSVGGIAGFVEQGRWKGILSLMQTVSCPYLSCGRIAGVIRRINVFDCFA